MPEGFYRKLPELLSQGDIIADIPWGVIEAPVTLCRPQDQKKAAGKAWYSCEDPWTGANPSQPVAWSKQNKETIHATSSRDAAIVLWHDCQIAKIENQAQGQQASAAVARAFAAVAPIWPLDTLQHEDPAKREELRAGVIAGEHHSYFYLPAVSVDGLDLPDGFVNLRHIWSVRQSLLLSRRRLAIAPAYLPALYSKLFTFFTRFRLDIPAKCPNCGGTYDLESVNEKSEGETSKQ